MIFRKKPTLTDSELIELLKFACKGKVVLINADIQSLPEPIEGCGKEYVVLSAL